MEQLACLDDVMGMDWRLVPFIKGLYDLAQPLFTSKAR
jgi:hypothetical protein